MRCQLNKCPASSVVSSLACPGTISPFRHHHSAPLPNYQPQVMEATPPLPSLSSNTTQLLNARSNPTDCWPSQPQFYTNISRSKTFYDSKNGECWRGRGRGARLMRGRPQTKSRIGWRRMINLGNLNVGKASSGIGLRKEGNFLLKKGDIISMYAPMPSHREEG